MPKKVPKAQLDLREDFDLLGLPEGDRIECKLPTCTAQRRFLPGDLHKHRQMKTHQDALFTPPPLPRLKRSHSSPALSLAASRSTSPREATPGGGFEEYGLYTTPSPPLPQFRGPLPFIPEREREALNAVKGGDHPGQRRKGDESLEEEIEEELGNAAEGEGELDEASLADLTEILRQSCKGDFSPFSSSMEAIIYLVAHQPTQPLSRRSVQLLLAGLRAADVPNLPSYHSYRQLEERMESYAVEGAPRRFSGLSGNVFYYRSIEGSIRRDLLHPHISPLLRYYPLIGDGLEDIHDGSEVRSIPPHLATPFLPHSKKAGGLFVNEPVLLRDGSYFFPERWIEHAQEGMMGEGAELVKVQDKFQVGEETKRVRVRDFDLGTGAVAAVNKIKVYSSSGTQLPSINPLRNIAKGRPVLSIPVVLWNDGLTGGGQQKQNSHVAVEFVNGALPCATRQLKRSIKLFSLAKKASLAEMSEPLVTELKSLATILITMWDVSRSKSVLILIRPLDLTGDIPALAEWTGSIGHMGRHPCRDCDAEKPKADVQDAKVLTGFIKGGRPRSSITTREVLEKQLILAAQNRKSEQEKLRSDTGSADPTTDKVVQTLYERGDALRAQQAQAKTPTRKKTKTAQSAKDQVQEEMDTFLQHLHARPVMSPLLSLVDPPLYFDLIGKTPPDPLHTLPLGTLNDLCKATNPSRHPQRAEELFIGIQALETGGIESGGAIDAEYLARRLGSLHGKEVLVLAQVMAVVLAPLPEGKGGFARELRRAWLAGGILMRLVRIVRVVRDYEEGYFGDIKNAIVNLVSALSKLDVSFFTRYKTHTITAHLLSAIHAFSLPRNFDCSAFESLNSFLRILLINTNQQAPSKDVATKTLRHDVLIHILTGGYYGEGAEEGKGKKAGAALLRLMEQSAVFSEVYRLEHEEKYPDSPTPSSPFKPSSPFTLSPTLLQRLSLTSTPDCVMYKKLAVPEDRVLVGNFVMVELEKGEGDVWGFADAVAGEMGRAIIKLDAILTSSDPKLPSSFAIGTRLVDMGQLAEHYDMPLMELTDEEALFPLSALKCAVNVQHDCLRGGCEYSGEGAMVYEERQATGMTKSCVEHSFSSSPFYILNLCACRSAHLTWRLFPRVEAEESVEEVVKRVTEREK